MKLRPALLFIAVCVACLFLPADIIPAWLVYSAPGVPNGPRILFVGNSLTFSGDIPGRVSELSRLTSMPERQLRVGSAAVPGVTLQWHAQGNGTALKLLREKKWDYVVLQEQSGVSCTDVYDGGFSYDYDSVAENLISEVKKAGAQPVLYAIIVGWYDQKQNALIDKRLCRLSRQQQVPLVPVNHVILEVQRTLPHLRPFQADNHHFSEQGALIAASTFALFLGIELPALSPVRHEERFLYQRLFQRTQPVFEKTEWEAIRQAIEKAFTTRCS